MVLHSETGPEGPETAGVFAGALRKEIFQSDVSNRMESLPRRGVKTQPGFSTALTLHSLRSSSSLHFLVCLLSSAACFCS